MNEKTSQDRRLTLAEVLEMLVADGLAEADDAAALRTERKLHGDKVHPLVQQFVHCDALQCGFCTPGMVMSGLACLQKRGQPTYEQMQHDLSGNLCRCGTYGRIMEAIDRTAKGAK